MVEKIKGEKPNTFVYAFSAEEALTKHRRLLKSVDIDPNIAESSSKQEYIIPEEDAENYERKLKKAGLTVTLSDKPLEEVLNPFFIDRT